MDDLSDFSSEIMEFKATSPPERTYKFVENSTGPDPTPAMVDVCLGTIPKDNKESQTENFIDTTVQYDSNKLAKFLRKICPALETELQQGPTPLQTNGFLTMDGGSSSAYEEESKIKAYQKITVDGTLNSTHGLATWLSVHTNTAPVLVLSAVPSHDEWCEHVNQSLMIFVPKRIQGGTFVTFSEVKRVPLKACLEALCTNSFDKNIFAGSTLDGEICIWEYESRNEEVRELFSTNSSHGYAVALDWSSGNNLLTCHSDGWIIRWNIGNQMTMVAEYMLKPPNNASSEITTICSLSWNDFVIGTKDGGVYHFWSPSSNLLSSANKLEMTALKSHQFMISTLNKAIVGGHLLIISCDLSGQVFIHDMRNSDDANTNEVVQIPLPFKNAIASSKDAKILYCPGNDGALEFYRIADGLHFTIKGNLRGKGNSIKISDNGCWIVSGLYNNDFQIFRVET